MTPLRPRADRVLGVTLLAAWSCARAPEPPPDESTGDLGVAIDSSAPDVLVGTSVFEAGALTPCADGSLRCLVNQGCPTGTRTTLSGTVMDPAGKNPLPNAVVWVPNDPSGTLPRIAPGTDATCSAACDPYVGVSAVAAAQTDAAGHFQVLDVPVFGHLPLVVQVGKWRRELFLDGLVGCQDNAVPASETRLPRKQQEGDIPQMAVLTGQCDALPCFMTKLGLDTGEFSGPTGGGRLHVYRGAGPGSDLGGGGDGTAGDCTGNGGACPLWTSVGALQRYSMVLLGCECGEHEETKPDKTPMHDWLGEGGRVLAVHYQDTWFKNGPADFEGVASWVNGPAWGATGPFTVTGPPDRWDGRLMSAWLRNVGAVGADGNILLDPLDVSSSVSGAPDSVTLVEEPSTSDAATDGGAGAADSKVLSLSVPIAAQPSCGRAIFTDVHTGGDTSSNTTPVPGTCTPGDMTAEEKVLEYLFFDLDGICAPPPIPPPPSVP